MKQILYILVLLALVNTSSATNEVIRDINVADKEIHVTISPDPFINFSVPGYYIEETIPYKYQFKSTTADWYEMTGQTLKMIRLMPTFNNRNITYVLINYGSSTGINDITGIYLDKNKNEGSIIRAEESDTTNRESSESDSNGDGWTHGDSQTASDKRTVTASEISPINAGQVQPIESGLNKQPGITPGIVFISTIIGSILILTYGYGNEIRARLGLKKKPRVFRFVDAEPPDEPIQENVLTQAEPSQTLQDVYVSGKDS